MSRQSRIQRYQIGVKKFLIMRSSYSNKIKENSFFEKMIDQTDHLTPIILLTTLNNSSKNKSFKAHHGYYMTSGVDVLMMIINILDNERYYYSKYDKKEVIDFVEDMPLNAFNCLSENIETLEKNLTTDSAKLKMFKTFYFSVDYIQKRIGYIIKKQNLVGVEPVKKLDIIKYKFKDENILKSKYSKLKKIKEKDLFDYVDKKYCAVGQIAFVIGWLLGTGDEKAIPLLESLGTNFGYMLKISNDFVNLERDIETAKDVTYNLIANYGIHHCFSIFFENKTKLIQGCMELDIYSHTIKEIIDYIEKCFDKCLNNTDLELRSMYSSFTTATTSRTEEDK